MGRKEEGRMASGRSEQKVKDDFSNGNAIKLAQFRRQK